ncbi:MAG: type VI-D CRISPR-associated RNA-guided ribonuclease Cas13d [Clostridia bacterium]|nr:type VI-D CRISPR-associated RNA-guided ribonuclease Cas13d [Clostridia bacterium]
MAIERKEQDLKNIKEFKGASRSSSKGNKLNAKKIGLKSTLIFNDKIALTSFAKDKTNSKNSSNVESITSKTGDIVYSQNPTLFNAIVTKSDINLVPLKNDIKKVVGGKVSMANPANGVVSKDYVGIKGALELKYFGKVFSNDNIHVQIAYNVADVKKILIPYVEQIIYLCYNLDRKKIDVAGEEFKRDVIGTTYFQSSYKNFKSLMESSSSHTALKNLAKLNAVNALLDNYPVYYSYFGDVFRTPKKGKGGKLDYNSILESQDYNYNVFRTLSMIRQACTHEKVVGTNVLAEKFLYDFSAPKSVCPDLYEFIEGFAKKEFQAVNADFCKNAGNNLYILSNLYPKISFGELVTNYYKYVVIKENNNLGINLRLVREIILYYFMPELKDKEYDSYRSKIYTIMGYVIYNHLKGSEKLEEIVNELRANASEDGRIQIYSDFAEMLWKEIAPLMQKVVALLRDEMERKGATRNGTLTAIEITEDKIADCLQSSKKMSYFAKLLLFVCKFLNGKEINELLTNFINKFDGIADLIYSANKCGYRICFSPEFKELEKAREIAEDLRIIKNVARMKREGGTYTGQMLVDAVNLLGIKSAVLTKEDVEGSALSPNESKAFLDRLNKNANNHQLRNFIINNVLKSKWFFYIIRYMKPEICATLMKNRRLVSFAIGEINDAQIVRYYQSVQGIKLETNNLKEGRQLLAKMLSEFNLDSVMNTIENMDKKAYATQSPDSQKEKSKALVTLYLTVAYLIVKNIVQINTRFSIAMSCLERDLNLLGRSPEDLLALTTRFAEKDALLISKYNSLRDSIRDASISNEQKRVEYKRLKEFQKDMHFSLHHYYCVKSNLETAKSIESLLRDFRNVVVHMGAVNSFPKYVQDIGAISSYYDVYMYTIQKILVSKALQSRNESILGFAQKYEELLSKHNTYVKDFTWIINAPFAYNIARYKNLSIKDLFYNEKSKEKISMGSAPSSPIKPTVEFDEVTEEIEEEEEFYFGYKIGQNVLMVNVEATARKGLRGVIKDTELKVTVSPAMVLESGLPAETYVGKSLMVSLLDWNEGPKAFSSEIIDKNTQI